MIPPRPGRDKPKLRVKLRVYSDFSVVLLPGFRHTGTRTMPKGGIADPIFLKVSEETSPGGKSATKTRYAAERNLNDLSHEEGELTMLQLILRWRLFFVLSLSLMAVYGLTACTMTTPNPNEKTAPLLTWRILNNTDNTQSTLKGSVQVGALAGDSFFIVFVTTDSGGVQQLTLSGLHQITCINAAGQTWTTGVIQNFTQVLNANQISGTSATQVPTSLLYPYSFSMPTVSVCPAGYSLGAPTFWRFSGSATNYANQQASATLDFPLSAPL